MWYERIALISPVYGQPDPDNIPAGLGYIAESLRQNKNEIEYLILDMNLGYKWDDVRLELARFSPDLIGISAMTYRYKDHYELARALKEAFPDSAIAMGGPHVSFMSPLC